MLAMIKSFNYWHLYLIIRTNVKEFAFIYNYNVRFLVSS